MHLHATLSDAGRYRGDIVNETGPDAVLRAAVNARKMLLAGFTTIRDLGQLHLTPDLLAVAMGRANGGRSASGTGRFGPVDARVGSLGVVAVEGAAAGAEGLPGRRGGGLQGRGFRRGEGEEGPELGVVAVGPVHDFRKDGEETLRAGGAGEDQDMEVGFVHQFGGAAEGTTGLPGGLRVGWPAAGTAEVADGGHGRRG